METYQDNTGIWRMTGPFRRENNPATIHPNGDKFWYSNDKFHRLHREDGPAAVYTDGTQYWLQNGKLHRLDGPAVINADGNKEYWAFGSQYNSFEELEIGVILDQ